MTSNPTHRCQGSLNADLSIRYDEIPKWKRQAFGLQDEKAWVLYENKLDLDWLSWYQNYLAIINYCPFCGQKLSEK